MALIIKFADKKPDKRYDSWDHSNKDAIAKGVRYIYKGLEHLPSNEKLFGFVGIPEGATLEQAIDWMMKAKQIHGAEEGIQCKHIIISFGKKPDWKKKKFVKLVNKIVGIWKGRFQVCWGFHHKIIGTAKENFHLHLLVNTVDMKTGNRLNLDYRRWRKFKNNVKRKWKVMIEQNSFTESDG